MDWWQAFSILSPQWFIIAILLAVFGAFILRVIFDILDVEISGVLLFFILIAVLIFLKIENIADPVSSILKAAGLGVMMWML